MLAKNKIDISAPLPCFVYGTLKQGGYFHPRCGEINRIRKATAKGKLYRALYPAVVLDEGSTVHGELFEFPNPTASIAKLDYIEGFHPSRRRSDNYYTRVATEVTTEDGEKVLAWIYVRDKEEIEAESAELIESGNWEV